jgi:hypothetical protein
MGKSALSSIVPASLRCSNEASQRLETIPGIGVIGAIAIARAVLSIN